MITVPAAHTAAFRVFTDLRSGKHLVEGAYVSVRGTAHVEVPIYATTSGPKYRNTQQRMLAEPSFPSAAHLAVDVRVTFS